MSALSVFQGSNEDESRNKWNKVEKNTIINKTEFF